VNTAAPPGGGKELTPLQISFKIISASTTIGAYAISSGRAVLASSNRSILSDDALSGTVAMKNTLLPDQRAYMPAGDTYRKTRYINDEGVG